MIHFRLGQDLVPIVDLSRSDASKKKAHMIQEAASPQNEIQRQGAPIIFLVDDDPSFLRALSRRLRAADYRVETFGSAEEFLTRRRSDAAGSAVLDLQMPGPGGLELQEALAQADEPLPVVFLTAHGDISSSVHAMKRGAVDFLTKPVRGVSCSMRCSGHLEGRDRLANTIALHRNVKDHRIKRQSSDLIQDG